MNWFTGLIATLAITYLITIFWEFIEYLQFGEIQHGRVCDNFVCLLYFIALWIGFSKW